MSPRLEEYAAKMRAQNKRRRKHGITSTGLPQGLSLPLVCAGESVGVHEVSGDGSDVD